MEHPTFYGNDSHYPLWLFFCDVGSIIGVHMARHFCYSVNQIEVALTKAKGNIVRAARILNCTKQTLHRYIRIHPHLKKTILEAKLNNLMAEKEKMDRL